MDYDHDHEHDHYHDHDHDHDHDHAFETKADRFLTKDVQEELSQLFKALPYEIPIYLFTKKGDRENEIEIARDLLGAFQDLSDGKIRFKELPLKSKEAKQWGVFKSPTLVFVPEVYQIKYLGVPLGEEGRTLVESIILIGSRSSRLNDQAQKVVARIDSERNIRVFVSPSCPYCPQQAVNAVKAALEKPDLISLEIIDTAYNEDLAEQYSAFSVPQTYANETLIAQGAQPEELFAASLESLSQETYFIPSSDAEVVETDLSIIGGGPAGLTAAIYAARSGINAVVIEKENLGGQVALTPVVENYPGIAHIGGKNLVDIMVAHALQYATVFPKESVMEIKTGERIEITTTLRKINCRAVLLATGASHKRLGAPGEDQFAGRGVSYCSTCDGPLFKGRKVAIVGGGNSAVTEALHLHHIGVKVVMIHRRDSFRAQEQLVEDVISKNIPIMWNTEVKEIRGKEKVKELVIYNNETGKTKRFPVDGVFVSIGYTPEVKLAQMVGAELTEEGYIKNDGQHRTNVPGVYSAGDVEGGYKQIVTAAGAGAAAAMTIFEDLAHPYWKSEDKAKAN